MTQKYRQNDKKKKLQKGFSFFYLWRLRFSYSFPFHFQQREILNGKMFFFFFFLLSVLWGLNEEGKLYWEFCGIFIWNFREFSVIFSHHSPKNPDWKMFEGKLSSISINKQFLLYFIALWKIPVENIPKISDKIKNFTNFLWLGDVGKLWIKKSLKFPTQKKFKLNFLAKNNTKFSHFPVSRTKNYFWKICWRILWFNSDGKFFKINIDFQFRIYFFKFLG